MKIVPGLWGIAAAVLLVVTPAAQAGLLLNNGSDGASDGWAVSGANQPFGGFTQFQSFTVTDAEGWNISTIGIDGYVTSDPAGVGLTLTLFPDVGGVPDEGNPLGSAVYFLSDDPFGGIDWRDEMFDVVLLQGAYWARGEANDANFSATWRDGLQGEPAFSRRNSDGMEFPHGPLALRISGVIPSPGTLAVMILCLGATRRRRS